MKTTEAKRTLATIVCFAVTCAISAAGWSDNIITSASFGPNGESGSVFNHDIVFNGLTQVQELDAAISYSGATRPNPSPPPTHFVSFFLSTGSVPGIDFSVTTDVQPTTIIQAYSLTNTSGGMLNDVKFFAFLDPDLDEDRNTFFNELGALISHNPLPNGADQYQIDHPDLIVDDIETSASLSNFNNSAIDGKEDYALALRFSLGDLAPGENKIVTTMISTDGTSIGGTVIRQYDPDSPSDPSVPNATEIFLSGQIGLFVTGAINEISGNLKFDRKQPGKNRDSFVFFANLEVTGGALDPIGNDVTIKVGTFAQTIPEGNFKTDSKKKTFRYKDRNGRLGRIKTIVLQSTKDPTKMKMQVSGRKLNLVGTGNPFDVEINIGPFKAKTSVLAREVGKRFLF